MSVIRNNIWEMTPYSPPIENRDANKHLLLDFNERTLPVSNKVREALVSYAKEGALHTYPSYGAFTEEVAKYAGTDACEILITNGSDHAIDIITRATTESGDTAIIPAPTFPIYKQWAELEGLNILEPPYTQERAYPTETIMQLAESASLVVIANPNNPTGTNVPREDIVRLAKKFTQTAILIDECYFEFTKETLKDLVEELPNLFITRTFSKTFGLPTLRLGYIISSKSNIELLSKIRGPYDINQFAIVAASAALLDTSYVEEFVSEVLEHSKPLFEKFLREKEIDFWPSTANFFFTFPQNPEKVEAHLRAKNILVRPKEDLNGRLGLRISLGTARQTVQLIEALEEIF